MLKPIEIGIVKLSSNGFGNISTSVPIKAPKIQIKYSIVEN